MSTTLVEVSDTTKEWYENESANIPWDFFDLATQNPTDGVNNYHGAYFGGFTDFVGASEVDDWTARALRGMYST